MELRRRMDEQNSKNRAAASSPKIEEISSLGIRQIINLIPHRYPFLLVDRVLEAEDDRLLAIKNVSIDEPFFMGHFPGRPVFPGVLQIEAMAQTAGIMVMRHDGMAGKLAFLMSCDRVKFRRVVEPGDQLHIEVKLLRQRARKIAVVEGQCRVGQHVASSAELMFMLADDAVDY
jgi:beta-hydroxyacyl-ACP dehydratase FabZ